MTIDGWSQGGPGYTGPPLIELDGSAAGGPNAPGLFIAAANVTVRGLAIHSFSGHGIIVSSAASGSVIEGNYIGTDVTGTEGRGNGFSGIHIFNSPGNTIGGTTDAARNVISGNGENGVLITGSSATGNVILGNRIGTNVTGTKDLGNALSCVTITRQAFTSDGQPRAALPDAIRLANERGFEGVFRHNTMSVHMVSVIISQLPKGVFYGPLASWCGS